MTADGTAGEAPDTPAPTPTPRSEAFSPSPENPGRDAGHPSPAPTVVVTHPPLLTPSPLSPFLWPEDSPTGSTVAHGAKGDVADSVPTAISVTVATGMLALMGVVWIALGIAAVVRRRNQMSTHATSGESDFGSPVAMPGSLKGATTFGVEAWELRPPPSVVGLSARHFADASRTPTRPRDEVALGYGVPDDPRVVFETHPSGVAGRAGARPVDDDDELLYRASAVHERRFQDDTYVDNPLHPHNRRMRTWARP